MREFALCKELTKKLAKDFGATPLSFGKVSLTHPDLLTNIELNILDENDQTNQIPVWYGEVSGAEGVICCLLAGLDTNPETLEFACVLGFKDFNGDFQDDGIRFSFHYDWANEEDPGTMVMKAGDKWLPISLAQRLQFVLGFEIMTQDGETWRVSAKIPELLHKDLTEIIEVDEKSD